MNTKQKANFWIILTLLEFYGMYLVLKVAIPFSIQVRDTGIASSPLYYKHILINGLVLFFVTIYLKWQLHVKFGCKNKTANLLLKFFGRIFLVIMGSLFGVVYLQTWVLNWKQYMSLVIGPLVLFAVFLFYEDFEIMASWF